MTERRVVEFGDVRYEHAHGTWWRNGIFDVTPQERDLVEELERCHEGLRTGAAERDRLSAELRRAETKVALLSGAMILDTGKSPVWPDDNTLAWEQVGPTPRRDEAEEGLRTGAEGRDRLLVERAGLAAAVRELALRVGTGHRAAPYTASEAVGTLPEPHRSVLQALLTDADEGDR